MPSPEANQLCLGLLLLLVLSFSPTKCQSTDPSPAMSSSSASSTSPSPLDGQIAHLKEDEALDRKRNKEIAKEEQLPLAYEDGDEPATETWRSSTSPMPRTGTEALEEPEEEGTVLPRQAPEEMLPNPGLVADPSLMPVQLGHPDYRPLVVEGPSPLPPPPTEGPVSTTVEQMGDEGGGGEGGGGAGEGEASSTTTEAPEETTTEADGEAETAQAEADSKQAEAAAAAEEAARETQEAHAKQAEANAAQAEAAAKEAEAVAATQQAEAAAQQQGVEGEAAEDAGSRVAEAMPEGEEAEDDDDDDDQDAIDALTQALQKAQLVVQNITIVLPSDSPSMQAFLGALLASRPAMLTQDGQQQEPARQLPQMALSPMPTPLPLVPFPLVPVRPSPLPQQSPALFEPTALSSPQMPMAQNYAFGPSTPQQRPPRPSFLVEVEQLNSWIKSGKELKLLDASYEPEAGTPDHIRFYSDYYAKWDKLLKDKKGRQFERSHIPGAIPFNLNVATYPSWNERQALYPPERFQEYVRRLGIDRGDQLVIYARGPLGGMLHAARAWFIFRVYGHENVSVLNGGLDAWRRADLPANDQPVEEAEPGNWTATFHPELIVTFEELTNADTDGFCILSRLYWYNFLDARPRAEFFGMAGTQLMGQQRNRLAGAKPFPADELVQEGFLVPPTEILRRLQQIGYARRQTIVMGNTADEASLALLALAQVGDTKARLYNGGMEEIRRRAAYLLTARRRRR